MPLTSARTKALKHQLRCLYFDILVGNRDRHFIPEKMWGEYVALVERMKLMTEDENNEAFMALVTEVFETMPRDFHNPSRGMPSRRNMITIRSFRIIFDGHRKE